MIDWKSSFRIDMDKSAKNDLKKEIVKLMLVFKLLNKYRKHKNFIRLKTEFYLDDDLRCSVYFENTKTKEAVAYDVRTNIDPRWFTKREEQYASWRVPFLQSSQWVVIDVLKMSDNINEINKELEGYLL